MAINITDSGSTISLEFTVDYNAGHGTLSASKTYIPKNHFQISYLGNYIVINDNEAKNEYKILYSDVSSPSGASASAIASTIEGYLDLLTSNPSAVNIAGAATTTIKSGAGILKNIIINKPVALGVITIYDNTAASGTKLGTITNPAALLQQQLSLAYNCIFSTGLTIVTSAADDITVTYV